MNRVFRFLDFLLESLLSTAMAIMAMTVFLNVVFRYVFASPLSWGEEVALIMLVWLTFLGAAVATRDKAHYAFDYLVRIMPSDRRKLVIVGGDAIVVLMTGALLFWSGLATWRLREWVTAALEISQAWVYAACPVGCLFIILYAGRNLCRDVFGEQQESTRETGDL